MATDLEVNDKFKITLYFDGVAGERRYQITFSDDHVRKVTREELRALLSFGCDICSHDDIDLWLDSIG